jgi:nucleoside-diphosphate-sugar epimerase
MTHHRANVKRIVFTSSSAAISLQGYAGREFDEGEWNEAALAEVSRNSRVVSSRYKYAATKTAAEKGEK